MNYVSYQESESENNGRADDPGERLLTFRHAEILSRNGSLLEEVFVRGLVGDDTEHTIGHIMDGVVASEE
jgi:hypothetical protein